MVDPMAEMMAERKAVMMGDWWAVLKVVLMVATTDALKVEMKVVL